jgi:regulatory protein
VDPLEQARETALAALARRALTEAELRTRLLRKGHTAEVVAECLQGLRRAGLVDDATLAYNFASRSFGEGRGPARVRAALRSRGVAAAVIDEAVAGAITPAAQDAALQQALRRLTGTRGVPADRKGRERLIRQLQRRGFSLSETLAALKHQGVEADGDDFSGPIEGDDDAVE